MTERTTKSSTLCRESGVVNVSAADASGDEAAGTEKRVVYAGGTGPGAGKHIVLISGDEEYRSEESLPMLGQILAVRHGFTCTVLFALDPDGTIAPCNTGDIPGLDSLASADLMIILTRFRDLPDEQMALIDRFLMNGKPVIGLRTATHAFKTTPGSTYEHYSNGYSGDREEWTGGFGRLVLGECWVNHHGHHKHESTRGIVAEDVRDHPIVRGCDDIWGNSDVYTVRLPLPGDSRVLVYGQVLQGMAATDPPVEGPKNDPMMPVAWTKSYQLPGGKAGRVFTTTMGAATDLESPGLRRLLVNAAYWAVGLEDSIDGRADVDIVSEYEPTMYGFGAFRPGLTPAQHRLD